MAHDFSQTLIEGGCLTACMADAKMEGKCGEREKGKGAPVITARVFVFVLATP